MTDHQQEQIKIIDDIERHMLDQAFQISTVTPVENFLVDTRLFLSGLHFPNPELYAQITPIIESLRDVFPEAHYYTAETIHFTIKNVKVINDPPHFTADDVDKARRAFADVIPHHRKFHIYFYRLLLFPNSVALMGTTDPELDEIIFDLDTALNSVGVPDDKMYANSRYFFCNCTLARFDGVSTQRFIEKVRKLSQTLLFQPYKVDTVTLASGNAVLNCLQKYDTWKLR
ncbi:hypothetical protein HGB07_06795 [Candidatus Roizmanbacteria bacterium]|nr:hypothetical protein [Candidatus Roizmanbacteria bacterium]